MVCMLSYRSRLSLQPGILIAAASDERRKTKEKERNPRQAESRMFSSCSL